MTEKTEKENTDKRVLDVSKIFETFHPGKQRGNDIAVVVPTTGGRWKHIRVAHLHYLLVDCETKWNSPGIQLLSDGNILYLLAHTHRLLVTRETK
jgi:hypothetical protein